MGNGQEKREAGRKKEGASNFCIAQKATKRGLRNFCSPLTYTQLDFSDHRKEGVLYLSPKSINQIEMLISTVTQQFHVSQGIDVTIKYCF